MHNVPLSTDCPNGRFGKNCAKECHCKEVMEACNKNTGSCKSGCHPGWLDISCQESMLILCYYSLLRLIKSVFEGKQSSQKLA